MNPEGVLVNGVTGAGEIVFLSHDAGGLYNGDYTARIDNTRWRVDRVRRFRDGGSTEYTLSSGSQERQIWIPRRIGNPDHTPRLDGKKVLPL